MNRNIKSDPPERRRRFLAAVQEIINTYAPVHGFQDNFRGFARHIGTYDSFFTEYKSGRVKRVPKHIMDKLIEVYKLNPIHVEQGRGDRLLSPASRLREPDGVYYSGLATVYQLPALNAYSLEDVRAGETQRVHNLRIHALKPGFTYYICRINVRDMEEVFPPGDYFIGEPVQDARTPGRYMTLGAFGQHIGFLERMDGQYKVINTDHARPEAIIKISDIVLLLRFVAFISEEERRDVSNLNEQVKNLAAYTQMLSTKIARLEKMR